jgi:hypothetical protein
MREHYRDRLPAWAERERWGALAWIEENLHVFWPAAQEAREKLGRGAVVVETTARPTGEGDPFSYLTQDAAERTEDMDRQRMVGEYNPRQELVITLLKAYNRVGTYRVRALGKKPEQERALFPSS